MPWTVGKYNELKNPTNPSLSENACNYMFYYYRNLNNTPYHPSAYFNFQFLGWDNYNIKTIKQNAFY